jgi:hypothetical protein
MADYPRIAQTTIRDYGRSYEETLKRNQAMPALLEDGDRIVYKKGGDGFDWALQYKRVEPVGNRGDRPLKFTPTQRFLRPYLDYRGIVATDVMSLLERLKNRGKEALIDYTNKMAKLLFDDMGRKFAQQVWNNGNDTTYPDYFHGIESFVGTAGSTVNATTGVIQAYSAADYVMAPNETYGGIDTELGAYGGAGGITGVWPNDFQATNDGDTYDVYSPIIANSASTAFNAGSPGYKLNVDSILRFLISASQKDTSKAGTLDVIFLAPNMWRQTKDYYANTLSGGIQRLQVADSPLRKLGFKDVIQLDGVEIKGEFGIPPGTGYGINIDQMEYRSMFDKLFWTQGPEYHLESQEWRVATNALGNFQFYSPKYFGKIKDYSGGNHT